MIDTGMPASARWVSIAVLWASTTGFAVAGDAHDIHMADSAPPSRRTGAAASRLVVVDSWVTRP